MKKMNWLVYRVIDGGVDHDYPIYDDNSKIAKLGTLRGEFGKNRTPENYLQGFCFRFGNCSGTFSSNARSPVR